MKSFFEQNSGMYSTVGDYCLQNMTAPDEPEYHIRIWGLRRLEYLIKHKRVLYVNLLTSGKLSKHLYDVDIAAFERKVRVLTNNQRLK